MAGCAWATVAVGCQLGSQSGYRASREPAGTPPRPRACEDIYDERVDGEERLHRDVDAARPAFTNVLLSLLVGVPVSSHLADSARRERFVQEGLCGRERAAVGFGVVRDTRRRPVHGVGVREAAGAVSLIGTRREEFRLTPRPLVPQGFTRVPGE